MANGNIILKIQNIGLNFNLSSFIRKNTTNKSQINIPTIYAGRAKVNFDAANASNNL